MHHDLDAAILRFALLRLVGRQRAVRAIAGDEQLRFRYAALRSEDDFLHLVAQREGEAGPLPSLAAFQRFVAGAKERFIVQPRTTTIEVVGSYRFFDEE